MTSDQKRLGLVLEKIDEANSADPNTEYCPLTHTSIAKELLYGRRMSEKLQGFDAEAPEELQIAARAQHIERWKSPRSNYPEGRAGYKKWRAELLLFHADRATALMTDAGYTGPECDRVQFLIKKRQLRQDKDTQTLEDVICLVFLEFYLASFTLKHSEEKLITIIQKTWGKMSEKGHTAALLLPFQENQKELITKALA